jgi:dienelactone hydrolase
MAEPLDLWMAEACPPPGAEGVRALAFELTSRGDRVPGRLLLPPGPGPLPWVLLQHGAGGSKEADYLDATGLRWLARGVALAGIDFPLHGERANPKLAAHLLARHDDPAGAPLQIEFVRQAVTDLRRTLDALAALPELDATRVAYAGFSLGSILGVLFCAEDPRPRAGAFALGGGGFGPSGVDPARHVARIAPRPVLFVNALDDAVVPRAAAETLHAAASEPKQVAWFEGTHRTLPGAALKAMWTFLARHLEVT